MTVEVKSKSGAVVLQHSQANYDLTDLHAVQAYRNLTPNLQGFLRQLYQEAAPVWICDLSVHQDLDPNTREIKCGAYAFKCGKEALYAGVLEIVYQMRCTLFHGEAVGVDTEPLAYFALSLLWRGSAYVWNTLKGQKSTLPLGKFKNRIRRYLVRETQFPEGVYVVLTVCVDRGSQITTFAPAHVAGSSTPCTRSSPAGCGSTSSRTMLLAPMLLLSARCDPRRR
jgi:hypothetical protein